MAKRDSEECARRLLGAAQSFRKDGRGSPSSTGGIRKVYNLLNRWKAAARLDSLDEVRKGSKWLQGSGLAKMWTDDPQGWDRPRFLFIVPTDEGWAIGADAFQELVEEKDQGPMEFSGQT